MAQIPEYQVSKFSPQAVGVPAVDRSGVQIGQAVQKFGDAWAEREDKVNTVAAMAKYGDFELAYSTKKAELQQQYRDRPKEYPAAVQEAALAISQEISKGLDSGVAEKFGQLTTHAWAQDADNAVNWSIAREQEIVVGNIQTTYQNLALSAERAGTVGELQSVLSTFDEASVYSQQFIDPTADAKLRKQYTDLAKESALMGQIRANPSKVYRELAGGAYAGVLDNADIAKYTAKARDAVYHMAEDNLNRTMFAAQGELLDLQGRIDTGDATIGELIAKRQAAEVNKDKVDANGQPIVPQAYILGLDNLISQMTFTNQKFAVNKDKAKEALSTFDREWDKYLTEKKIASGQPDAKDIINEMVMYANLSDLQSKGIIDGPQFRAKVDTMRTKLALRVGNDPLVKSFDQAIAEAGKIGWVPWRDKSDDVFAYGYREIKNYVEKAYGSLDATAKQDLKAQMLSQYTQRVKNAPEATIKALGTDVAKQFFAHQLVYGSPDDKGQPGVVSRFTFYKEPTTGKTLLPGDSVVVGGVSKQFVGLNPETGKPFWKVSDVSKGQIITNARGEQAEVVGVNAEGQPILRRLTNGR